jgi:hypothetical protein
VRNFYKFSAYFGLWLFLGVFCMAQNTVSPTGIVTDPDSQAWVNASWSWTLYNPSGGGSSQHYKDGSAVPKQVTGVLDATGAFTGPGIPNNNQIVATGTQAQIMLCSVTSAPNACQSFRFAVTSDSPTIGSRISSLVQAPRMEAAKANYAYNTTEIQNPVQGTGYTNTASVPPTCFIYQPTTGYVSCGGGTSIAPAPPGLSIQLSNPGVSNLDSIPTSGYLLSTNTLTLPVTFSVIKPNNPTPDVFSSSFPVPNQPPATGANGQGNISFTLQSSGAGKNMGNFTGGTANDQGWRTLANSIFSTITTASGIADGASSGVDKSGSGDAQGFGIGISGPGGVNAASDEGYIPLGVGVTEKANGTGTIQTTTGTGDTAPVTTVMQKYNDQLLIDTSRPQLSTTVTAVSSTWAGSTLGLQSLPIASGATPSTGIAITTTYIAGPSGSTLIGTPFTQSFTATNTGQALTTGLVWVVSSVHSEQCTVSGLTGTTTQTGTIDCAYAHSIGSIIMQGGTHGVGVFDADNSQGVVTDFIIAGAFDSTHLALVFTTEQGIGSLAVPVLGSMYASATAGTNGLHVYSGARVVFLASDKTTATLEQNDVAWTVGDNVVAPSFSSFHESLVAVVSNQVSLSNPSVGDQGVIVATSGGGHTFSWTPFIYNNHTPQSTYSPTTNKVPPSPYWAVGAINNFIVSDDIGFTSPVSGSTANGYCYNTWVCDHNPTSSKTNPYLFQDTGNVNNFIQILRSSGYYVFGYRGQFAQGVEANEPTSGLTNLLLTSPFNAGTGPCIGYNILGPDPIGSICMTLGFSNHETFDVHQVGESTTTLHVDNFGGGFTYLGNQVCVANAVCSNSGERGTSTLVNGTITVTSTTIGTTAVVELTNCNPNASTALGTLSVGTRVTGTSFVINSLSATNTLVTGDQSSVCWFLPH